MSAGKFKLDVYIPILRKHIPALMQIAAQLCPSRYTDLIPSFCSSRLWNSRARGCGDCGIWSSRLELDDLGFRGKRSPTLSVLRFGFRPFLCCCCRWLAMSIILTVRYFNVHGCFYSYPIHWSCGAGPGLIDLRWLCGAGCVCGSFRRLRVAFPLPSHFRAFHKNIKCWVLGNHYPTKRQTKARSLAPALVSARARFAAIGLFFVQSVEMSNEAEQNIQTWKIKKLIKSLDAARGCVSPFHSRSTSRNTNLMAAPLLQCWYFDDQPHHSAQSELRHWRIDQANGL